MAIVTIGLDLAKHVFQVHGVDEDGRAALRRQLRRTEMEAFFTALPPCLVGMDAGGNPATKDAAELVFRIGGAIAWERGRSPMSWSSRRDTGPSATS